MNKPPTVLIVDDEPAIADLAEIALRRHGYQVLKATRPSQALDIASQTRGGIDLLLADVWLPEMEVMEMQGQIRNLHPTARTLLMSGHPEDALGRKGIKKEKHNVLFKPCSIRTLVKKVHETLSP